MKCETTTIGDVTMITCSRGSSRAKPCQACGETSTKLCDYALTGRRAGRMCSAPICGRCAVSVGPEKDLCPTHDRFVRGQAEARAEESRRAAMSADEHAAIDRAYSNRLNDQWLADLVAKQEHDDACAVEVARNPTWPFPVDDASIPSAMEASGSIGDFLPDLGDEPPPWEAETSRVDAAPHAWFCSAREPGDDCDCVVAVDTRATAARAETIASKVAHVARARQSRVHGCHWTGCELQCKPAQYMCRRHWYMLPKRFRDAIWREYRSGQEGTLSPSRAYLAVVHEVDAWILLNHPPSGSAQADRAYAAAAIDRVSYQEAVDATRARDSSRRDVVRDPVAAIVDVFGDAAIDVVTRHDANENDPRDPRGNMFDPEAESQDDGIEWVEGDAQP